MLNMSSGVTWVGTRRGPYGGFSQVARWAVWLLVVSHGLFFRKDLLFRFVQQLPQPLNPFKGVNLDAHREIVVL